MLVSHLALCTNPEQWMLLCPQKRCVAGSLSELVWIGLDCGKLITDGSCICQEDNCQDDDSLPDAPATSGQTVSGESLESAAARPTGTPSMKTTTPSSSPGKHLLGNEINLFGDGSTSPKASITDQDVFQSSSAAEQESNDQKHPGGSNSLVSETEKGGSVGSSCTSGAQTPVAKNIGFGTFDESTIGTPTVISLPIKSNDGFNVLLSSLGDKEGPTAAVPTQEAFTWTNSHPMFPSAANRMEGFGPDTQRPSDEARRTTGAIQSERSVSTYAPFGTAQAAMQGQWNARPDHEGPSGFGQPESRPFINQGDRRRPSLVGSDNPTSVAEK